MKRSANEIKKKLVHFHTSNPDNIVFLDKNIATIYQGNPYRKLVHVDVEDDASPVSISPFSVYNFDISSRGKSCVGVSRVPESNFG